MWQILYASFWKFSKLSNSGISLNWPIINEVITRSLHFWPTLCTTKQEDSQSAHPPRPNYGEVSYVGLSIVQSTVYGEFRYQLSEATAAKRRGGLPGICLSVCLSEHSEIAVRPSSSVDGSSWSRSGQKRMTSKIYSVLSCPCAVKTQPKHG